MTITNSLHACFCKYPLRLSKSFIPEHQVPGQNNMYLLVNHPFYSSTSLFTRLVHELTNYKLCVWLGNQREQKQVISSICHNWLRENRKKSPSQWQMLLLLDHLACDYSGFRFYRCYMTSSRPKKGVSDNKVVFMLTHRKSDSSFTNFVLMLNNHCFMSWRKGLR